MTIDMSHVWYALVLSTGMAAASGGRHIINNITNGVVAQAIEGALIKMALAPMLIASVTRDNALFATQRPQALNIDVAVGSQAT